MAKMTRKFFLCLISLILLSAQPTFADVRCVQEFLSETSFDPGPIDGLWGRKTRVATEEFLTQVDREIPGGVSKNTMGEVCALLTGEEGPTLLAAAKLRRYDISIDAKELTALTGRKFYDFSKVEIATNAYFNCGFTMGRRDLEDGRIKETVSGRLDIVGGKINFLDHRWGVGGLADSTYLENEAIFVIDKEGQVHGEMIFFHLITDRGDTAKRPRSVTLPESFEAGRWFPGGTTEFDITRSYSGFFRIQWCVEG